MIKQYLHKLLSEVTGQMFAKGEIAALPTLEISYPKPQFGDYATNIALILAKQLKQNPATVADRLVQDITALDQNERKLFEISQVNGFINIKVKIDGLADSVYKLAETVTIDQVGTGQKVIFEYSSPNTNKALHIGHTRNDTYGVACINLLKAVGYNVISCEVINDRGTHIMKSMLMYQRYGNGETPASTGIKPDHFVNKYYVLFSEENSKLVNPEKPDEPTALDTEVRDMLERWEAGDAGIRALWRQMNDWWYEGAKVTYAREGSTFDEVDYESDVYDKGRDLVMQGVDQGLFVKESDGSVSVDLSNDGLDKKYLLRSNGTTMYITQDLYLWYLRNERHHPDMAIVTTAIEQSYHFAVLKKIFEMLKYPWASSFRHLPYEHVYLGKDKMSSRAGKSITADGLVDLIKNRVKEVMASLEKNKEQASNDALVEKVAFAAIKYGYLKYEPNTRIYFDPEQTIALEGNTGPYLQYAYARIQSILRKAGDFQIVAPNRLNTPEELALMRYLLHYSQRGVVDAARDYKPNLLCNYLFELAGTFSTLYSAVPILVTEDQELKHQRLTLLSATANTLRHGLNLLGIEAPEEM